MASAMASASCRMSSMRLCMHRRKSSCKQIALTVTGSIVCAMTFCVNPDVAIHMVQAFCECKLGSVIGSKRKQLCTDV